jgi:hypothetical protein
MPTQLRINASNYTITATKHNLQVIVKLKSGRGTALEVEERTNVFYSVYLKSFLAITPKKPKREPSLHSML